jgi:hypothetical protein
VLGAGPCREEAQPEGGPELGGAGTVGGRELQGPVVGLGGRARVAAEGQQVTVEAVQLGQVVERAGGPDQGDRDSWTQLLFTMPSAVAVINSLLGGVTVAVAIVSLLGAPLPVGVPAGMVSGTASLALHVAYQIRRFAAMRAGVAAEFPSARRPRLIR